MRDAFAQNYEVVDALSSANIVVHPNGNDFNKSRAPTLVSSELLKYAVKGKGFQDLSVQGVVDASGLYLSVATGFPGSLHDVRMLRLTDIYWAAEDENILMEPAFELGMEL
ncbi:uncharacterized protein LOC113664905 [Pocillopora damicornis]|uniref:uncharacterized protein LOC113664905 n=1 Tax=Pocillopora damicornis TaxID=46731 RepID=UPI000F556192|nr:uncharacterized protein LOC113664905 [Pocillopora damicornis]